MIKHRKLTDLKNIGKKIAGRLNAVGVFSEEELRRMGAVGAHRMIKENYPEETLPVCYYLYSFEGALTDKHWDEIGEHKKQELKAKIALPEGDTMSAIEADAWFSNADPAQRATLIALRNLIRSVAPEAVEMIKWSRLCYSNASGLFCYLHSTKSYATLGFENGAALSDPECLLEGTGKNMRHIKFKQGRSPDNPAVLALLTQAASEA